MDYLYSVLSSSHILQLLNTAFVDESADETGQFLGKVDVLVSEEPSRVELNIFYISVSCFSVSL